MSSPETFGFEPDENGDIRFETIQTDFQIENFEDYGEFVRAYFLRVAEDRSVMPIITFPEAPQGWNREE